MISQSQSTPRNSPIKPNHIPASTGGRQAPFSNDKDLMFPCDHPTNASFGNDRKRLQTFSNWPNRIKATPQEIAEAGFYYLGERDRCKCFYCNGGLQNWDKYDDPWMEHAKWFPNCEYVLRHKGLEYVESINAQFPDLRRPGAPIHRTPMDYIERLGPPESHTSQYTVTSPPCNGTQTQSSGGMDIPPPESMDTDDTYTSKSSPSEIDSELLQQIEAFGFDKVIIHAVVERKKRTGSMFNNLCDFLDAVQAYEEEAKNSDQDEDDIYTERILSPRQPIANTLATTYGHQHLNRPAQPIVVADCSKNILQNAFDELRCKICKERERDCVFTSCGHMSCCFECSKSIRKCPICKSDISNNVMKIYKT